MGFCRGKCLFFHLLQVMFYSFLPSSLSLLPFISIGETLFFCLIEHGDSDVFSLGCCLVVVDGSVVWNIVVWDGV